MLALIAAMAKNRVIGKDGRIPWHIPGEQKRFRALTLGNAVVMGRRTYAEIGKPLPGRENVILTRNPAFPAPGCRIAASLDEALALFPNRNIYIAGGGTLYREALPLADALYLTELEAEIEGDTFFPDFDPADFTREAGPLINASIPYRYVTYCRITGGPQKN